MSSIGSIGRTDWRDWLVYPLLIGGLVAATAAPVILFIECFEWLFSREWPGLTLSDGLGLFGIVHTIPESETQRFIDVVMAIPLTVTLFLTGIFMALAGAGLGSWDGERRVCSNMPDHPLGAFLFLAADADVGTLQFVRLLLLDMILRLLLWAGVAMIALQLIVSALGLRSLWIALAGVALIAAAAVSRRVFQRKLDLLAASGDLP